MRCAIELSFDLVDDICLAHQGGSLTPADLSGTTVSELGPIVELRHAISQADSALAMNAWLDAKTYGDLTSAINGRQRWYAADEAQGVVRIEAIVSSNTAETELIMRAKRAAMRSGFTDDHAGKVLAAMLEIYGNVIDHSENVASGFVAYASKPGCFEFVIADQGIGVLQSLRSNPKYARLADAGTALELALSEGVSRYEEGGRGMGFRPLFVGLANLSESIRFRSGDCAQTFTRLADGSIRAETRQVSNMIGLFAAIRCEVA